MQHRCIILCGFGAENMSIHRNELGNLSGLLGESTLEYAFDNCASVPHGRAFN